MPWVASVDQLEAMLQHHPPLDCNKLELPSFYIASSYLWTLFTLPGENDTYVHGYFQFTATERSCTTLGTVILSICQIIKMLTLEASANKKLKN